MKPWHRLAHFKDWNQLCFWQPRKFSEEALSALEQTMHEIPGILWTERKPILSFLIILYYYADKENFWSLTWFYVNLINLSKTLPWLTEHKEWPRTISSWGTQRAPFSNRGNITLICLENIPVINLDAEHSLIFLFTIIAVRYKFMFKAFYAALHICNANH